MKKEPEKCILVSSLKVTNLLIKLIRTKGHESIPKVNIPNLADYSTKFKNIR